MSSLSEVYSRAEIIEDSVIKKKKEKEKALFEDIKEIPEAERNKTNQNFGKKEVNQVRPTCK